tara:strand:- start:186 stop:419 length:234 start_codon:yes stop_codon:yes gene_type:complete
LVITQLLHLQHLPRVRAAPLAVQAQAPPQVQGPGLRLALVQQVERALERVPQERALERVPQERAQRVPQERAQRLVQ